MSSDGLEGEEGDSGDDSWNEEEDLKDYRKGGYHPVKVGDAFSQGRYSVLSKVGWGHFSTVWLAWDSSNSRPTVLKFQKSAGRYSEAAKDEVELLRAVCDSANVDERFLVLMQDHFVHRGVNGLHHVMGFEVLGPTLLSLIKQTEYQGLPLAVVRRIAYCVLTALAHLHDELSIIHTDLKPENVLCVLPGAAVESLVAQARASALEAAQMEQDEPTPPAKLNVTAAEADAGELAKAADDEACAEDDGAPDSREEEESLDAKPKPTPEPTLTPPPKPDPGGNDDDGSAAADGSANADEAGGSVATAAEGLSKSQRKRLKQKEKQRQAKAASAAASNGGAKGDAEAKGKGSKDPRVRTLRTPPIELEEASLLEFKVDSAKPNPGGDANWTWPRSAVRP